MASLQQEPTGTFHIIVRIDGKRYNRSLTTKSELQAVAKKEEIQETIDLIKRGKIIVPENIPVIDFVLASGKISKPAPKKTVAVAPKKITLTLLFDQFLEAIPTGNIEKSTLKMMHIHKRHLLRILTPKFDITQLTGLHLQQYINKRSNERTQFFARKSPKGSKQEPSRL